MLFSHLILDLQSSQQFSETHHWHRNKSARIKNPVVTQKIYRNIQYKQITLELQLILCGYKESHLISNVTFRIIHLLYQGWAKYGSQVRSSPRDFVQPTASPSAQPRCRQLVLPPLSVQQGWGSMVTQLISWQSRQRQLLPAATTNTRSIPTA